MTAEKTCDICDGAYEESQLVGGVFLDEVFGGVCARCWLDSVESGVHEVKDLPPALLARPEVQDIIKRGGSDCEGYGPGPEPTEDRGGEA